MQDDNGQTVIPVFYDVDPSEVRNQRESFAEAFVKHESMCKDDVEGMQKVQGWRTALTAAANLKGYDIRQGIESKNIQQIVEQISSKLCKSASLSSLRDVVGMNVHLEKLKSLFDMETDDVRIVGIWGMGGVGDLDWFGNGSRVVVTTRNRHLIEKDDAIYEVTTLPDHEATQLFNQHAFKKEVPSKCFMKLSFEVVNHAKGLPLALKVWGSFLHKRNINVWRSAIERMKNNSSLEIIDKLKISYDGLSPYNKTYF
ncbi:TMV resistance protein N-like [Lycium ferocissimum]|uniref:TMV resistance protein N-like n=1 Tax=Lycium ferocissimum TaxID=112874 RepID=UPI0028150D7C|nr:TMV resistance protein N-like [Lycium ferocissimum]